MPKKIKLDLNDLSDKSFQTTKKLLLVKDLHLIGTLQIIATCQRLDTKNYATKLCKHVHIRFIGQRAVKFPYVIFLLIKAEIKFSAFVNIAYFCLFYHISFLKYFVITFLASSNPLHTTA